MVRIVFEATMSSSIFEKSLIAPLAADYQLNRHICRLFLLMAVGKSTGR